MVLAHVKDIVIHSFASVIGFIEEEAPTKWEQYVLFLSLWAFAQFYHRARNFFVQIKNYDRYLTETTFITLTKL